MNEMRTGVGKGLLIKAIALAAGLSTLYIKRLSAIHGNLGEIANVPDYAYYSETNNSFIWRELYEFGFIDSDGIGVDYPFINGKHYPYENFIFRIIPEGTNSGPLSV